MPPLLEAYCPACREETLIRTEAVYEGFKKVGDRRVCASCGHEFPQETIPDTPPAKKPVLSIFADEDEEDPIKLFTESEKQRCCRYCRHYILNPFTQRCGLHERDVEATDLCNDFERMPPHEPKPAI